MKQTIQSLEKNINKLLKKLKKTNNIYALRNTAAEIAITCDLILELKEKEK